MHLDWHRRSECDGRNFLVTLPALEAVGINSLHESSMQSRRLTTLTWNVARLRAGRVSTQGFTLHCETLSGLKQKGIGLSTSCAAASRAAESCQCALKHFGEDDSQRRS